MKRTYLVSFLLLLSATIGWSQPQPQPPVVISSPEVHVSNSVTFRFRDPNAHEVIAKVPLTVIAQFNQQLDALACCSGATCRSADSVRPPELPVPSLTPGPKGQ